MIKISQKRIKSIARYLPKLPSIFFIGIEAITIPEENLKKIGFDVPLEGMISILPSRIGPVTTRNADGEEISFKDLPKIKKAFYIDTTSTDWHGNVHPQTVLQSRYVYQKEIIPPQEERMIVYTQKGKKIISSSKIFKHEEDRLLHVINLFLECFGECQILDQNLEHINKLKAVNWKLLPKGNYPWEILRPHLEARLKALAADTEVVIKNRFEFLYELKPDFTAVGVGGFSGYVVFAFDGIFILESMESNNATYVFDYEWEAMSKLTKREIIQGDFCRARIIHNRHWKLSVKKELGLDKVLRY